MTAFRVRLDTTTNWAITSSAVVGTFALGNAQVAPGAILFLMLLNYFFLHLEARRYRHYEVSRQRVQIMESGFYLSILDPLVDQSWIDQLREALSAPGPPLTHLQSVGRRLRRNYIWIYLGVLLTWLSTLDLIGGPPASLAQLFSRLGARLSPRRADFRSRGQLLHLVGRPGTWPGQQPLVWRRMVIPAPLFTAT